MNTTSKQRVPLKIILSGFACFSVSIGNYLTRQSIFLIRPDISIQGLSPYKNPQLASALFQESNIPSRVIVDVAKTQIENIYKSFAASSFLPEAEPDQRLNSVLYKYQKQALYFMIKRETAVDFYDDKFDTLWKPTGSNVFKNLITETSIYRLPDQIFGGIIADDMGLGKTIQMISLILSKQPKKPVNQPDNDCEIIESSADSKKYTFGFKPELATKPKSLPIDTTSFGTIPSATTLIVCPLSTISNWDDQIEAHTKPGSLSVYIYHGANRTEDPMELVKYDIVLTTYNLLASGFTQKVGIFLKLERKEFIFNLTFGLLASNYS